MTWRDHLSGRRVHAAVALGRSRGNDPGRSRIGHAALVTLEDQDRSLWDAAAIAEATRILEERAPCRAPKSGVPSCRDSLVLVDESAEDVPSVNWHLGGSRESGRGIGRTKVDAPVRPGPVVVLSVRVQDALKMTPAEDQHVVEALPSHAADPTLRERVRPRCLNRRPHHLDPFGPEDLVERARELAVSISEEDVPVLEASGDREIPRLLSDPGRIGPTGRAGDVDPSGRKVNEEQDVERLQEHRLDREEVARQRSPPLRSEELGPGRAGPPRRRPQAGAAKDQLRGAHDARRSTGARAALSASSAGTEVGDASSGGALHTTPVTTSAPHRQGGRLAARQRRLLTRLAGCLSTREPSPPLERPARRPRDRSRSTS